MVSDPSTPLSPRQRQILTRIAQFIAQQGRPPTRADLARGTLLPLYGRVAAGSG